MSKQPNFSHPKYRSDIDGLRAVAVLSVVTFHVFPDFMKGGFTGVDVFFVISGYLISTIIFENLDNGTFSFKEFYGRRIKRIFPALILVLTSCFIFGWFVLFPNEYKQLGKHIAGSSSFVQNIVLWKELGYFDNSAETKPLLHIWSLGIEEQFYFIWPLLIWFTKKRELNLLLVTLSIALISFILNIQEINKDIIATFFSPQTRFWELLCGGLLAWTTLYSKSTYQIWGSKIDKVISKHVYRIQPKIEKASLANVVSFLGAILVCYSFWKINKDMSFPGKWALIPVFGTVLIIFSGPKAWVNKNILSNRIIVWFGLISFPLYLWHWPLLSFATILESQTPDIKIRIAVVLLSIVLAWLTYQLIERPIRLGVNSKVKITILMVLMICVGFLGYNNYIRNGLEFRFLNSANEQENKKHYEESIENCKRLFPEWSTFNDHLCLLEQEEHNSIALIGDSHAGHLFSGISKELAPNHSVAVFSASCAAPFINVATGLNDIYNLKARKVAHKLIMNAYDYIIKNPEIKIVIMVHHPQCSYYDAVDIENASNKDYLDVLRKGMKRTFSALIQAGKQVLVVFDNPKLNFDPKRCKWRPLRLTKVENRCSFPRKYFEENQSVKNYRLLVEEVLKDYPQVRTIDLANMFCDKKTCEAIKNGNLLYEDDGHLNRYGSEFVAPYILAAIADKLQLV